MDLKSISESYVQSRRVTVNAACASGWRDRRFMRQLRRQERQLAIEHLKRETRYSSASGAVAILLLLQIIYWAGKIVQMLFADRK
jgi:hypothetical protein